MSNRTTFDSAFEKAHRADTTRTPEAIRQDIGRQEYAQRQAILSCIEISGDKRRRLKAPLTKPYENMASDPIMAPVIGKERAKYDAAAAKIVELERELAVSEQARA